MYRPPSQLHQADPYIRRPHARHSEAQGLHRLCQSCRITYRLRRGDRCRAEASLWATSVFDFEESAEQPVLRISG